MSHSEDWKAQHINLVEIKKVKGVGLRNDGKEEKKKKDPDHKCSFTSPEEVWKLFWRFKLCNEIIELYESMVWYSYKIYDKAYFWCSHQGKKKQWTLRNWDLQGNANILSNLFLQPSQPRALGVKWLGQHNITSSYNTYVQFQCVLVAQPAHNWKDS